jgi:hypothetical protein
MSNILNRIDGYNEPAEPAKRYQLGHRMVVDDNVWICNKTDGKKQWMLFSIKDEKVKKYSTGVNKSINCFISSRAIIISFSPDASTTMYLGYYPCVAVSVGSDKTHRGHSLLVKKNDTDYLFITDDIYSFKSELNLIDFKLKSKIIDDTVQSYIDTKSDIYLLTIGLLHRKQPGDKFVPFTGTPNDKMSKFKKLFDRVTVLQQITKK